MVALLLLGVVVGGSGWGRLGRSGARCSAKEQTDGDLVQQRRAGGFRCPCGVRGLVADSGAWHGRRKDEVGNM